MKNHIRSGQLASHNEIINTSQLITQYYTLSPDPNNDAHNVLFGTSGHRGSSQRYSFNEAHVLAISQSIAQVRAQQGITGPCYIGKDTHALSEPAFISVIEVLAANFVDVIIQKNNGYTPTPVISHAITQYNKNHRNDHSKKADGIIITASHNPPEDGGIKYNSIYGGPASSDITRSIEQIANKFLINNLQHVHRMTLHNAWKSGYIHTQDFIQNYVKKLSTIINMQAIKASGLKLRVHPLGGSSIDYWQNIAQYYQLDLNLISEKIDKTFSFMHLDYDGCIRVDCSSEFAMAGVLIKPHDNFDLILVNDPDCDRHGIITPLGLIKPNHYLIIAAHYLFNNRPLWHNHPLFIGKTYVSSIMMNRVACNLSRPLIEVPVGFKWFVQGLFNSFFGFVGEESAGASFLDFYCSPWSTDKDGLIMCLLAAEMIAINDKSFHEYYDRLVQNFEISNYNRIQLPINYAQKSLISKTLFNQINMTELADDPIIQIINISSSKNQISMDGVKIITHNGWVACRLSGTEPVYKIYCESFLSVSHKKKIEKEIISVINNIIN
ncbi:phosphoglucomutase [Blochmannia endosymbiont of Camponotus sp. C-003]|uniref:phosphoglucomutase n=1 Tax=unclassified Candidatus Blochmanniella TaxID=711328 RepID=UPI0020245CCE|nr:MULTISPECIES: phosphoglucomutase [unclassified Candidatus Blochmannia]URJ23486.1 phosphoglucomutase [Blochmannia endosymbiont of Camponotus sp. C-003]URJ29081.1 phosphoglucomutase [Blochmannia endosymbiont of Camponotus sp. C-046]